LNLFREDRNGNDDFNYQTLVRPQLQQNALNQQFQRQNLDLSRRVQSIAAHNAYQPQGATDVYPTGHETAFGYTGHYYPQQAQRRK
jgi:bacillopeptidase F (M6 metalloprotease family)